MEACKNYTRVFSVAINILIAIIFITSIAILSTNWVRSGDTSVWTGLLAGCLPKILSDLKAL